jgi:hypothetical protein
MALISYCDTHAYFSFGDYEFPTEEFYFIFLGRTGRSKSHRQSLLFIQKDVLYPKILLKNFTKFFIPPFSPYR